MNTLRSLLFTAWLYLSMPIIAIGLSPILLAPHRYVQGVCKLWARIALFGLRWIAGVKVEVRGLENAPSGAALIASKHQGMLDIVALLAVLPDACFVMKKELMPLPFFGWFAWRAKMIAVDRAGHAKALKDMTRQARDRLAEGRQIVIFPEGTRVLPGETPPLKSGFAGLYRALALPTVPIALDSGVLVPRKGAKHAGAITIRYGAVIPPGLPREEIEARVHAAINVLDV